MCCIYVYIMCTHTHTHLPDEHLILLTISLFQDIFSISLYSKPLDKQPPTGGNFVSQRTFGDI